MDRVEQLSIFLENRAGRLAEVTKVLASAGINIRALSVADTSDFGILRIIVSNNEKAKQILKGNGFTVKKTTVVPVEVEDKPGGLHKILEILREKDINIEYMYAFVQQSGKNAVLIFRFDRTEDALELLKENNIKVLSGKEVYNL